MNDLDAFRAAQSAFEERVAGVTPDQLGLPTPCDEWDVRTLIDHVIAGDLFATRVLAGATVAEAAEGLIGADVVGEDPLASFRTAASAVDIAFSSPGALERVVHHPVGDILGSRFLDFRTLDYTGHSWDLARATGQDETFDPALVTSVLRRANEYREMLNTSVHFGGGASGERSATEQWTLLDALGRRP